MTIEVQHTQQQQQQQQQQSLFFITIYNFNILTGPRIASASLAGQVHQDII